MDSIRQIRISRLIQKELSELFRVQTATMPGVLITITSVTITPDLSIARIRLSFFPSDRAQELLSSIRANATVIRHDLAKRIRHLRKLPDLTFFVDDTLDYLERVDELLKK